MRLFDKLRTKNKINKLPFMDLTPNIMDEYLEMVESVNNIDDRNKLYNRNNFETINRLCQFATLILYKRIIIDDQDLPETLQKLHKFLQSSATIHSEEFQIIKNRIISSDALQDFKYKLRNQKPAPVTPVAPAVTPAPMPEPATVVVEPTPIIEPEPIVESEQVAEITPDIVIDDEPTPIVVESTPIAEPTPIIEPEPVAEPAPAPIVLTPDTKQDDAPVIEYNYMMLDNKKKMNALTLAELIAFGAQLDKETRFSTKRIKDQFRGYIQNRIDNEIENFTSKTDSKSLATLIGKYGTFNQQTRFDNAINKAEFVVAKPDKKRSEKQPQPTPQKQPEPVAQPTPEPKREPQPQKQKRERMGFLKKTGRLINQIKTPLIITGVCLASVLLVVHNQKNKNDNTNATPTNAVVVNENPTEKIDTKTTDISLLNQQNPEMVKKVINILTYIKTHNPIDSNMDVKSVTSELVNRFGNDAYNVVLSCAMAPYALNNSMHLDIRPTTHNMIEYMCTHQLSDAQKSSLNQFMSKYIHNGNIDMTNFVTYQRHR